MSKTTAAPTPAAPPGASLANPIAIKKWQAQIMVNRKCIYIGRFANLDDAVAARNKAKSTMHTFVN